jgi:L-ribulose-5-phosphate 4-epimerase
MRLWKLRQEVLQANQELVRRNLVFYTFGNVSGISRAEGLVAIKPSGVPFEELRADDIVLADLDGKVVEGELRPSSDLPTHVELYKAFSRVGGVVHSHSTYATAWAQAGREIPCYGTSQADYWHGAVPVTDPLSAAEIAGDYEKQTGLSITRRLAGAEPASLPGVLVHGHGPFCWGESPDEAVFHAVILEELARMAYLTAAIEPAARPLPPHHVDKHFFRKHGPGAYYGQKPTSPR